MGLFDMLFRPKGKNKSFSDKTQAKEAKAEWDGPTYVFSFQEKNGAIVPHYRIKGQDGQWIEAPSRCHLYYDPIEDCPEFQKIAPIVARELEKELGSQKKMMGICHRAWAIKKRILKEQYGIDWRSAEDLNPGCHFD